MTRPSGDVAAVAAAGSGAGGRRASGGWSAEEGAAAAAAADPDDGGGGGDVRAILDLARTARDLSGDGRIVSGALATARGEGGEEGE